MFSSAGVSCSVRPRRAWGSVSGSRFSVVLGVWSSLCVLLPSGSKQSLAGLSYNEGKVRCSFLPSHVVLYVALVRFLARVSYLLYARLAGGSSVSLQSLAVQS